MSSGIANAPVSVERTTKRVHPFRFALAGNPNSGKTTLFNALSGLRAHTANYPGTTVEQRLGRFHLDGQIVDVVDIPGLYDLKVSSEEEQVALNVLTGANPKHPKPDAVVVVADATNLSRSLFLTSQIIELKQPVIVALNMVDVAEEEGIEIDSAALQRELGCSVVPIVARTGRGVDNLRAVLQRTIADSHDPLPASPATGCDTCGSCRFQSRYAWTDAVSSRCVRKTTPKSRLWTERIDRVLTHPVIGVMAFFAVMMGVFFLIFQIATIPMDLIDALFSGLGGWLANHMPESDLRSLLTQGVIGGVGGMLVFLPQICILFFCLSLLDDTGYLARAAFVMDRLMRRVGLSGKAFVPLLSAHACAIPAIMATRVIEDKRDRLVTILVAPLISCSARIPVYSMLAALLFSHDAWKASLVFTGAYSLGIVSAILAALVFKRTILKGETRALVLELPSYKLPSFKTAFLTMIDRASVFVRKAGTVMVISIILWALATYPKSEPPAAAVQMQQQAETLAAQGATQQADELRASADRLISHDSLANSAAGRLGHWIEPVIRPLGFDWQIGIGIVSSFAAREVIVSTLAVVYGVGEDVAKENPDSLYDSLRQATRTDGSKVFTTATCASLLVFYIFAMQCLATQAVTRRETGTWKWPIVQLVYMTILAYTASFVVYQSLRSFGIG